MTSICKAGSIWHWPKVLLSLFLLWLWWWWLFLLNWSLEDVLYYMVKEKIWVVLRRCVNWNVFGCANFINVKPFSFWLIAFTQWPDQQWPSQFQWDYTTILYFAACYWCTNWKQTTCAQGRLLCCNVWGNLFCCTCWLVCRNTCILHLSMTKWWRGIKFGTVTIGK